MRNAGDQKLHHFVSGGFISALGVFVLWEGSNYSIGSMGRIGPGFMPIGVAWLLILMGVLVVVESFLMNETRPHARYRPLLAVALGMLLWALTIERFGLYIATFALVFTSALGEQKFRPVSIAVTALVLSLAGHLIFIRGLSLPFEAFSW